MKIYEIVKDYPLLFFAGTTQCEVSAISYDSRKVLEQTLFVCLEGENTDGHKYIREACDRGASAILLAYPFKKNIDVKALQKEFAVSILAVSNTRDALAYMSKNFYLKQKKPKIHLLLADIGKGSCAQLIYQFLVEQKKEIAMIDDMRIHTGEDLRYASRTHPEMPELCAVLSELDEKEVFLPLSFHDLSLGRGAYLDYASCLLLKAEEKEILEAIKLQPHIKSWLINSDEVDYQLLKTFIPADVSCVTYGINSSAQFRAHTVTVETRETAGGKRIGTAFHLSCPGRTDREYFVALPGRHQVYNALAILTWLIYRGIDETKISEYLSELSLPGRAEIIAVPGLEDISKSFTLMIDNAWSPRQLEGLLSSLRQYCKGRLLVLASSSGNRDGIMRKNIARTVLNLADYVCFSVADPRSEGSMAVLEDLTEAVKDQSEHFAAYVDREVAMRKLFSMAKNDDFIVLTGKAQDNYRMGADSSWLFSETELAKKIICDMREEKQTEINEEAVTTKELETDFKEEMEIEHEA